MPLSTQIVDLPQPSGPPLGLTSTIPVEIILAARRLPVDLNNRFITHPCPLELIQAAEEKGLPRTLCAWIKGMYAWLMEHPEVQEVMGITQGDCSNTHALLELLQLAGRKTSAFEYPYQRNRAAVRNSLLQLASALGVTLDQAEAWGRALTPLRQDLAYLDELTWTSGQVSGAENHLWLVSASDFDGDPQNFHQRLHIFLREALARPVKKPGIKLGLLGVPPITTNLHQAVRQLGGEIVFNEVSRQFAMPAANAAWSSADADPPGPQSPLVEQYLRYTYPYDVFHRLADIKRQSARRGLTGLIHYAQAFCYRQTQELALRACLDLPILSLEGDRPGPLDDRSRLRLEAFMEMLS